MSEELEYQVRDIDGIEVCYARRRGSNTWYIVPAIPEVKKLQAGGLLVGESHDDGGIRIETPEGDIEAEGGEVIVTKPAVDDQETRTFEGKELTNCEILSEINQSGGGVPIPCDPSLLRQEQPAQPDNTTAMETVSMESYYLSDGKKITDNKSGATYKVVSHDKNGLKLIQDQAIGSPEKSSLSYESLLNGFSEGSISIEGYSNTDQDRVILELIIRDMKTMSTQELDDALQKDRRRRLRIAKAVEMDLDMRRGEKSVVVMEKGGKASSAPGKPKVVNKTSPAPKKISEPMCPAGTEVYAFMFDKDKFTLKEAKEWLKAHNKMYGKVKDYKGSVMAYQKKIKSKFKKDGWRVIDITDGIRAKIACPKKPR